MDVSGLAAALPFLVSGISGISGISGMKQGWAFALALTVGRGNFLTSRSSAASDQDTSCATGASSTPWNKSSA